MSLESPTEAQAVPADTVPLATPRSDRHVEGASEDSFPASDPPQFTRTRSGRANRASPAADAGEPLSAMKQWALDFVAALDAEAPSEVADLLADDVVVRWGNGAPLVGRDAAIARLEQSFAETGPLLRHVIDVRGDAEAVFIELEVTGTRGALEGTWPEAISARLRVASGSRASDSRVSASRVTVYAPDR